MCGIVGVIKMQGSDGRINLQDVHEMMHVQRHRGPDDTGACGFDFKSCKSFSSASPIDFGAEIKMDGIIGFNRLSIKDLSPAGHQPMTALNGNVILAFNGEIYNDKELRIYLEGKGHTFTSATDTEVVLNSFLEFGFDEMLRRLNGMFAIVIVDLKAGKVFWRVTARGSSHSIIPITRNVLHLHRS
jgi:asparagine synthase (glutamine-hydrolysing)